MKSLDRRWIFLSMGLVVFVFLRVPLGLHYTPSRPTQDFYKSLEALPPGSLVFLSADYGPDSQAELLPMHEAVVYQLLKKDVRIIGASMFEPGPPLVDGVFERVTRELEKEGVRKKYGVDYVNLGFKSGQDVAIAKIGSSIPETFPVDYRSKKVTELPILDGVKNFDQIALLCEFGVGTPGPRQWLQQVQTRYKVRMAAGVTAVMAPDLYSFYQSGQMVGFLGGLVGAAEYEYLLGRPGLGMKGMNVQSLAHFLVLGFVAVGNVIYFLEWRRRRREGGAKR